jgi:hypothetical protein
MFGAVLAALLAEDWTTPELGACWTRGIAPSGLPRIRTCPLGHAARHVMSSLPRSVVVS